MRPPSLLYDFAPRTSFDPVVAQALRALDRLEDPEPVPTAAATPVQRFAAAVLATARADLTHPLWAAHAAAWVRRDGDHPGGFVWCCQALGADPSALRRAWRALRPLAGPRPAGRRPTRPFAPRTRRLGG